MTNKILNKFKEKIKGATNNSSIVNNSFNEIFNDITNNLEKNRTLSETIVHEIIELGDYIEENKINITSQNKESFYEIYHQLKSLFRSNFDFIEDCKEVLLGLKVNEVRETEKFYKLITSKQKDFSLKISYKDGFVFSADIPCASLYDNMKVLEVKSFIARAISQGAVFIIDYFDFEQQTIFTAGFVFNEGEFKPLKESFLEQIHKIETLQNQKYFAFN